MTKQHCIQGWVARDSNLNGSLLALFFDRPEREPYGESEGYWSVPDQNFHQLPTEAFPELTWEDEPVECKVIIKLRHHDNTTE